MTALTQKVFITPEEYLVMEAVSPVKHEYFEGEVFQMAGASFAHNRLSMNISGTLFGRLDRGRCSVVQNDMRLFVEKSGLFTYPDVMVVCGEPEIAKIRGLENLVNPVLIVEVLSPSTEAYDKGVKFDHYRGIGSLKEYVLVWQDKKRLARYTKKDDQNWLLTDFIGDDATIDLLSVDCALLMEEIYDKVDMTA
jgi:Uma2 family endonuclease